MNIDDKEIPEKTIAAMQEILDANGGDLRRKLNRFFEWVDMETKKTFAEWNKNPQNYDGVIYARSPTGSEHSIKPFKKTAGFCIPNTPFCPNTGMLRHILLMDKTDQWAQVGPDATPEERVRCAIRICKLLVDDIDSAIKHPMNKGKEIPGKIIEEKKWLVGNSRIKGDKGLIGDLEKALHALVGLQNAGRQN